MITKNKKFKIKKIILIALTLFTFISFGNSRISANSSSEQYKALTKFFETRKESTNYYIAFSYPADVDGKIKIYSFNIPATKIKGVTIGSSIYGNYVEGSEKIYLGHPDKLGYWIYYYDTANQSISDGVSGPYNYSVGVPTSGLVSASNRDYTFIGKGTNKEINFTRPPIIPEVAGVNLGALGDQIIRMMAIVVGSTVFLVALVICFRLLVRHFRRGLDG